MSRKMFSHFSAASNISNLTINYLYAMDFL